VTTTAPVATGVRRPRMDRDVAARLAPREYDRLLKDLRHVDAEDWRRPTDCPAWTVRDMAGVTPQATGHGPISALVGDILVTTRRLDECVVHPEGWARVGAGVKWLRWSRRRRHIASPRSRARSPTSASWATPPAAVSVRWPEPTDWRATESGPSRLSPATVSCGA
jgi:hypothetical protein